MRRKVLFLCNGNSCRSQMAEAIVNARLGDAWEAYSAGTRPTGYVHPLAIQALAEIGIVHDGHSKHADEYRGVPFDLVVTVCDDAAENCPVWLGQGKRVHLGFPDPARATGTEDEVIKQVARGHTNQEIADRLSLSVKTVETYRARAMEKLGLANRAALVRYALAQGWLGEG